MVNERQITITEWIEATCPYCRFVYYSILKDIQARRIELNRKLMKQGHLPMPPIEIKLVDVQGNVGSQEMQWFYHYSQKIGGLFTPAIRVGDSGKVFYLWGKDKEDKLTEKQLSSTDKLKVDILREIQDILQRLDRDSPRYNVDLYNPARCMEKPVMRVIHTPYRGFVKRTLGGV